MSAAPDDIGPAVASSVWHHVQKQLLIGDHCHDDTGVIMRGCDAIVATLDVSDNTANAHVWARTIHAESTKKMLELTKRGHATTHLPADAMQAIDATRRWSSNFVRHLGLCPWAGASLDTIGAIRYWVILMNYDDQGCTQPTEEKMDAVLQAMENTVREAGVHLEAITNPSTTVNGMEQIDPFVAISFVILVDRSTTSAPTSILDFSTFNDFFMDLEDRLLDECDDYWDCTDPDSEEENEKMPIGCKITPAAFHPDWQFGQDDIEDESGSAEQPIDFEKKTPYPTISCVMSTAIDALVKESTNENDDESDAQSAPATERIAVVNEKILTQLGSERLRDLFNKKVLQCPMKG